MLTGVTKLGGVLALGLCLVIAGCGDTAQQVDVDETMSSRSEALLADAPERDLPEEPAPDSAEYERAKMVLAGATAPGSESTPEPLSESPAPQAVAVVQDPGCRVNTLARNDDGSTGRITLPFSINFFGTTYNSLFINNNGNVTFNAPLAVYTPFTIHAQTPPIIAPFFADVDTRASGSNVVQYSGAPITFEGRPAFCVNWVNVGYYAAHADKLNSFQLLLVDRNDTGVGNFDICMNYDQIRWETGDASGGSGGFGGTPAGAGFSAGNGNPAAFFQFPGSLVRSAFLDTNAVTGLSRTSHFSNVVGRHCFGVRFGQPVTDERITLAPLSATGQVGTTHTVVATLKNDQNQPLPNRAVTFRVLSGPNGSLPPTVVNSNASGVATFSYVGAGGVGQDRIQASFVKTNGQIGLSDIGLMDWTNPARPPVALCRDLLLVADNTCGASGSINNGSFDPDGDLVGCTQSPGPVYGLGNTSVTLTCTDQGGRSASCTGIVTVQDNTAPSIQCPSNQVVECVALAATVDTGSATASDNCGAPGIFNPGPASYPLGTSTATHSATDLSGNSSTCSVQVTVADTLAPSLSLLGASPMTLECAQQSYVEPGATAADLCYGNLDGSISISGTVDSTQLGSYPINYSVADGAGHSASATRTVDVVDTTPPQVIVGPTTEIWPPNHTMHSFNLSDCASTLDLCSGLGDIDARGTITSIYSDEPEDVGGGGDGHTLGDIQITGNSSFQVRAERQGASNGRVYGVTFAVTDGNGNTQTATCHFSVPHDDSGVSAVDDGPGAGYTVTPPTFLVVAPQKL